MILSQYFHGTEPLKVDVSLLIFSSNPQSLYNPKQEANENIKRELPNTQMYPPESNRNAPSG